VKQFVACGAEDIRSLSGEEYDCEIGIPPGFAISASRKPPVTIAVKLTTLGTEERTLIQDIKRKIPLT
jgi:hypothetical protein